MLHHTYSAAVLFFWLSSIVHITSHIFCCCSILLIVKHRPCYITHILLLSILLIVKHSPCYITHILLLSILLIVKHSPCYITHILLLSILLIVKHRPRYITPRSTGRHPPTWDIKRVKSLSQPFSPQPRDRNWRSACSPTLSLTTGMHVTRVAMLSTPPPPTPPPPPNLPPPTKT